MQKVLDRSAVKLESLTIAACGVRWVARWGNHLLDTLACWYCPKCGCHHDDGERLVVRRPRRLGKKLCHWCSDCSACKAVRRRSA